MCKLALDFRNIFFKGVGPQSSIHKDNIVVDLNAIKWIAKECKQIPYASNCLIEINLFTI